MPAVSRPRVPELLCGAGLAVNGVISLVLLVATPSLLAHHVILLEMLSTGPVGLVTAGALARVGRESLALALIAPLVVVVTTDVFFWWAGRLWGNRLLLTYTQRAPRMRAWVERAEGWVSRHGIPTLSVCYFLPIPNPAIYVLCGAGGMRLRTFLVGDTIGTLLWTTPLVALGWQVGQRGVDVVDTIDRYTLWVSLALVAVVVLVAVLRRRRQLQIARTPPTTFEEPAA